jgi:prepilin-type N-terminal cleavage/methylation domain-containing protein
MAPRLLSSEREDAMMRDARGLTLVELAVTLGVVGILAGAAGPVVGDAFDALRVQGATDVVYSAVHLSQTRARATGLMHGLVVEPDGRALRVVEDPTGSGRTVSGPHELAGGAVASSNAAIRFTARGFAVPAGTVTIRSGAVIRRVIVNVLGRARVASGPG